MRTVTLCALLVCLITSVAVAQPFDIRAAASQAPALEHLQRFDFVDQSRIGLMGFSWGAMVGLRVNRRAVAEALSPSGRFASVASFYPACHFSTSRGAVEFLRYDSAVTKDSARRAFDFFAEHMSARK